jgi:hypothetical protein
LRRLFKAVEEVVKKAFLSPPRRNDVALAVQVAARTSGAVHPFQFASHGAPGPPERSGNSSHPRGPRSGFDILFSRSSGTGARIPEGKVTARGGFCEGRFLTVPKKQQRGEKKGRRYSTGQERETGSPEDTTKNSYVLEVRNLELSNKPLAITLHPHENTITPEDPMDQRRPHTDYTEFTTSRGH